MSSKTVVITVGGATLAVVAIYQYLKLRASSLPATFVDKVKMLSHDKDSFAPEMPSAKLCDPSATAYSVRVGPLVVQPAKFNALWLRIGSLDQPSPDSKLLQRVVTALLEVQSSRKHKAAVYVAVSERCLQKGQPVDLEWLASVGFKYHHHRQACGTPGRCELVYVADLAKMVPEYATGIEGSTALVLSPDGQKILSVWERGGWNTPGGAVDEGECKIEALKREVREEVGAIVDDNFSPVYLGGYQLARARDDRINDNFSAFLVKATSTDFQVDGKEIHEARWLPWKELHDAWVNAQRPTSGRVVELTARCLPEGKTKVSTNLLKWLGTYHDGSGMPCKVDSKKGKVTIGHYL